MKNYKMIVIMNQIFMEEVRRMITMNNKEFLNAVDAIVKEKSIDKDVVYEAMELALSSAYKKNFNSKTNVKVLIDKNTGDIKVYSYLTVVEDDKPEELPEELELDEEGNEIEPELFNIDQEIKLTEARKINKLLNVGDTIDTEVTPKDFGRVAASTAKQVVIQKIREAERNMISEEFGDSLLCTFTLATLS